MQHWNRAPGDVVASWELPKTQTDKARAKLSVGGQQSQLTWEVGADPQRTLPARAAVDL